MAEKLRVLGTVLGLMIKIEKRILMNHAILDLGLDREGVQIMTNLKNLVAVEHNINQALAKHKQK